jgi:hypothetical protein
MARVEQILQRADGSEVKIVAQEFGLPGHPSSVGVHVLRRESAQAQWKLCDDRPHPDWRQMSVDEYARRGRSEMLRTVTHGEILKMGKLLREKAAQEPLPFMPGFIEVPSQGLQYDDYSVHGEVAITEGPGTRTLAIYEWSSRQPSLGNTVRALKWMRARGITHIEAHGVGTLDEVDGALVGDIATVYWAHMMSKGLVDRMFDDNGAELVVQADGSIGYAQAQQDIDRPRSAA